MKRWTACMQRSKLVLLRNRRGFGICEACLENSLYSMSDEVLFTEIAGIEVDFFEGLPAKFVQKVIPEGRYAIFTHTGTLRTLPQTFHYIWGTWFLNTKEETNPILRQDNFSLKEHQHSTITDQQKRGVQHPSLPISANTSQLLVFPDQQ